MYQKHSGVVSAVEIKAENAALREEKFDFSVALQLAFEGMSKRQFNQWQQRWNEYKADQASASALLEALDCL